MISNSDTKLLVTTALEQTWGSDEPIAFLGEWCRLYDRKDVWMKRSYQVVPNHWDDREKLREDYGYLERLHGSLLVDIANAMNRYHQIDHSLRFWQMILDPWLLTYIAVIWDRWECLRLAFGGHEQLQTIALASNAGCKPCFDYEDFIQKSIDDPWNYRLFLEIIESNYSSRCKVHRLASVTGFEMYSASKPKAASLRHRLAKFVDGLLGLLPIQNRVVFFQSYFPRAALLKLNLSLKQLPSLYLNEFEWPIPLDDSGLGRGDISLDRKAENSFETFLLKRIVKDLPYTYVEGFSALRTRSSQIQMNPKIILTGTGHWGNELFKLWSAEQVIKGCKLIPVQHGGSINFGSMMYFNFEEEISDNYATWALPLHPKQVRLPASKLIGFKVRSEKSFVSLIGVELPRYALRAGATPVAGQILQHYDQSVKFYRSLDGIVKLHFRVRPYPDCGWNTRNRYIDDLGVDKLIEGQTYYEFFSCSKIIICTYPNTTFAESMASGLPTLLLYPRHLWELNPAMDALLKVLMAAKIIFHDSQTAAAHLNAIWDDPDQWWNSPDVVYARNEFHRQAVYLGSNWLSEWAAFIKGVLHEC